LLITNIQHFCLDDGPGIRTTVFTAGCNMRCLWCHNPEAVIDEVYALIARKLTVNDILNEIYEDKAFYQKSSGGVTFSGGEPVLQAEELFEVLKQCKQNGICTALETGGNYSFGILEPLLKYIDLLIVDCKAVTKRVHIKCTGKTNTDILDNIKRLSEIEKRIWIRIPVIWNVNITVQELMNIGSFLKNIKAERIELLPYHKLGISKYNKYHLKYPLQDQEPPTEEQLEQCKNILGQYRVVTIVN